MRQSIRLGTVRGVAVGVHWSVVVLLALFTWTLAEYELPVHPGHAGVADWAAGATGAVAVLLSLFAHEVSHALVARRNGVEVRSITLFVFGGLTQLGGEAHTPRADFRIAAVGPATSVVLAGVFLGADALASLATGGVVVATLAWLWEINLLLGLFNAVPAAPLDGGRILRAALWRHWGDHTRASVAAARFGRGFGFVCIVLGVLGFFYIGFTALWVAMIGFFLYVAAGGEEQYALIHGALAGLRVDQVMTPAPPCVRSRTAVVRLVTMFRWPYRGDALVVTDDQGAPTGVVTAASIRRLRPRQLQTMTAGEIAIQRSAMYVARPDERADLVVEHMVALEGRPALVIDEDGRLVGVLTMADVERAAGWAAQRR